MNTIEKLAILADAAKYDASCASSGSSKRNSLSSHGIGSTEGSGICHAYAPDGRCISLLKVLLTNFCIYECAYCINRNSSNTQRARFSVDEVVNLTLDFYRRNYIEGLFLSSGVIRNPDYTMEQLVEVARSLREDHDFRGYIHLKTIPDADGELLTNAGKYADRLSINVELPSQVALENLAPEKSHRTIKLSMARIRARRQETVAEQTRQKIISNLTPKKNTAPKFAPAGQSTQMIIGAEPSSDVSILQMSTHLYASYELKRVYYSAFSPIEDAPTTLPSVSAPLVREHRLYQSDWLMRFYGFNASELVSEEQGGMLDLQIDPKLSWALRHRHHFPVDLNTASREMLLRVPGLGVKTITKILKIRRWQSIKLSDLIALRASVKRALPFIVCTGYKPIEADYSSERLRAMFVPPPEQQQQQLQLAL